METESKIYIYLQRNSLIQPDTKQSCNQYTRKKCYPSLRPTPYPLVAFYVTHCTDPGPSFEVSRKHTTNFILDVGNNSLVICILITNADFMFFVILVAYVYIQAAVISPYLSKNR